MEWIWPLLTVAIIITVVAIYIYVPDSTKPSRPEDLKTEQKFESVGPFKIAYKKMGKKGPAVLLIHGIGASAFSWRHIQPLLAEEFSTIAIDLPGFGKSSKLPDEDYGLDAQMERILSFCKQLKIKNPHLVGCSMGGTLAIELKENHPELFSKVIAINPALNPKLIPLKATFLVKMNRALNKIVTPTFVQQIMYRVFNDENLIYESSINSYYEPYKNNPNAITCFIKSTELLRDKRLIKKLTTAEKDLNILYCPKDKIVKPQFIKPFFDLNPNVLITEHKSAGHHLMEEKPRWTYDQISHFFNGTQV